MHCQPANSGWQFEGQFDGLLGTVIAPNYFITAKHIGGVLGDKFTFNGTNYTTTAVFPDPSNDLQIWRVSGTFPIQAPLYAGSPGSEANLFLTVFGRGTQRGNSACASTIRNGVGCFASDADASTCESSSARCSRWRAK
jgi:hypothetical protein